MSLAASFGRAAQLNTLTRTAKGLKNFCFLSRFAQEQNFFSLRPLQRCVERVLTPLSSDGS